MKYAPILIVDDEPEIRERLAELIEHFGHHPLIAADGAEALAAATAHDLAMALVDLRLPDTTGIELIRRLRAFKRRLPVAIITGHASVPNAVEAMRAGAFDYLEKPFKTHELQVIVEKGLRLASVAHDPRLLSELGQTLSLALPSDLGLMDEALGALEHHLELIAPRGLVTRELSMAVEELMHSAMLHLNGLDPHKNVFVTCRSDNHVIEVRVAGEAPRAHGRAWQDGADLELVRSLVDELELADGEATIKKSTVNTSQPTVQRQSAVVR